MQKYNFQARKQASLMGVLGGLNRQQKLKTKVKKSRWFLHSLQIETFHLLSVKVFQSETNNIFCNNYF
jgi:hypothetical protein